MFTYIRYRKPRISKDLLFQSHTTIQLNKWDALEYRLCNQYHRNQDQSAIIRADGTREWWKDGREHREGDQPAIIYPSGTREWWKDGKYHREGDQPAYIDADGHREWWIDGKQIK